MNGTLAKGTKDAKGKKKEKRKRKGKIKKEKRERDTQLPVLLNQARYPCELYPHLIIEFNFVIVIGK